MIVWNSPQNKFLHDRCFLCCSWPNTCGAVSYHMLTEAAQSEYTKYNRSEFHRKQVQHFVCVSQHWQQSVTWKVPVVAAKKKCVILPWGQGRTKRRGCCCISCWLSSTQHSFWHWHLEDLLPDSVSLLEDQRQRCNNYCDQTRQCYCVMQPACSSTFIYCTLLQVGGEEERRPGVHALQAADPVRFPAEKGRAAPRVRSIHAQPQ